MLKKLTKKYWYKPVRDYLKSILWVVPLGLFPLAGGAALLLKDITDFTILLNSPLEVVIGNLLGIWAVILTRELLYIDVKNLIRDIKWQKSLREGKNGFFIEEGYILPSDPLKCTELKFDEDEKNI